VGASLEDGHVTEGGTDQLTAQPKQDPTAVEHAKQQVRDRTWALLEREGAAKPPGRVVGKIPNFLGAEAAADQLAALLGRVSEVIATR
jgi:hypothetical protein